MCSRRPRHHTAGQGNSVNRRLEDLQPAADAYLANNAEIADLSRASNLLFSRCMRQFGFEPHPPRAIPPLPFGQNEMRYGLTDEHAARTIGYHVPQAASPPARTGTKLSPAAQAVADGTGPRVYKGRAVPAGGCTGEAGRELMHGAPVPPDPQLAKRLSLQSFARTKQESHVHAAFAGWSGCMRSSGFLYATPEDANNDPAFQTRRASAKEIATATADVRCKRQVNLVNIWGTAETLYQQGEVATLRSQLDVVKRSLQVELRNATRALATP
jgi:hypothetical protein